MAWYDFHSGQGWSSRHDGVDVQTPQGTPLSSLFGGTVLRSGFFPWGGEVDVGIRLPDGRQAIETFAHLSQLTARAGQTVTPQTILGLSGGANLPPNYSTGPHTHYSLFLSRPWANFDAQGHALSVNPEPYLDVVRSGGGPPNQAQAPTNVPLANQLQAWSSSLGSLPFLNANAQASPQVALANSGVNGAPLVSIAFDPLANLSKDLGLTIQDIFWRSALVGVGIILVIAGLLMLLGGKQITDIAVTAGKAAVA